MSDLAPSGDTTVRIEDLTLDIPVEDDVNHILRGIDLTFGSGEIQGLAGESGSGKTMTGLAMIGLEPPNARLSGQIWLNDLDLAQVKGRALNAIRGRRVGTVFQDPSTSLHPQLTVGSQLTDHVRHHLKVSKAEARQRAVAALDRVGVPHPSGALARYPHEFSGGQRQRVAIALACSPEVLIADEPTTALDVTVQAGVLRLIRSLVDDLGLAVLFITHDLGVMSAVADRVAVMRQGQIVEHGPRAEILTRPQHPYTQALLAALPGARGGLNSKADLARLSETTDPDRLNGTTAPATTAPSRLSEPAASAPTDLDQLNGTTTPTMTTPTQQSEPADPSPTGLDQTGGGDV
ncbi:MAG: ABC transporter ATP-binding protein [Propionibacteriaceae bacterium]|jgi:ABC-type dipeptide/oligopeptide/nickel transport system ATPase component|nr:ABC transporter ATP-binding protein [Propionibacteriaceae bacterium]